MLNLGDKVKDTVTGFEGIVIARTEWLHGCTRCLVQPDRLDKDGNTIKEQNFDEPQLVLVKAGKVKAGKRDTGGPMPAPQRNPDPTR